MADDNLINNPSISPVPQVPREPGFEDESQALQPSTQGPAGQREFALPEKGQTVSDAEKVTPMDLAGEGGKKQTPEEISGNLQSLKTQFQTLHQQLLNNGPTLSASQLDALKQVTGSIDPEMRNIAKRSNSEFSIQDQQKGEGILGFLTRYMDGSQGQLQKAVEFLGKQTNPNPAQMLSLQMSVQRATQKAELASSIISSGVSGFKAIMGTQLG